MRRRLLAAAVLILGGAPFAAPARAAPVGVFDSTFPGGKAKVVDPTTGGVVVRNEVRPVVRETILAPSMSFTPARNGFDITLTYRNATSLPQPLGQIIIDGIMLGPVIDHWDFRGQGTPLVHDRRRAQVYVTGGLPYPQELYSPVILLSDERYTVGISLLYSAAEYLHPVTTHTFSVGGRPESDRSWSSGFHLRGDLPPGQTRQYTLALRLMATDPSEPNGWVRTLTPYRDFFRQAYGTMRYTPDRRPVLAVHMSSPQLCKPSNPRGWVEDTRRPDLYGWDGWVNWIPREMTRLGFDRVMIWAASGNYLHNQDENFPFLALSPIKTEPALFSTFGRLQTLPQRGPSEVGYWWGRSQEVMRVWDSPTSEILDPNNPDHVTRAMRELGVAVELGAQAVGLDAFSKIPYYDAYHWLERMRARAPGVKFISELDAPDLIHLLGPTYLYGHQTDRPHLLADLLMPGHETWTQATFPAMAEMLGRELTLSERQAEIRRIAALGYIPVIMGDNGVPDRTLRAAESFRQTIPPDLFDAPPPPPPPPSRDPRSWSPPRPISRSPGA